MSSRSSQYVEVQLEIGHKATPKTKQGPDGHTHDWTVFVRGPENSNIQHFVEKVVFHLHESFPKPKRVVKDPPYQVSESGYASFELPVEVYFKNKEEPKKICFDYDLYLRLDDAVSHSRREKLTFQNPSNDFKKKLLKAGGVTNESNVSTAKSGVISDEKQSTQQTSGSTTKPVKSTPTASESTKKSKTLGVIPSKDKSLNNSQNPSNVSSNQSVVSEKHSISSSNNKQFTDLFGPPIQARPPSESKSKEISKSKFTAIASKGVKNDSKSVHKKSYSPSPQKNSEIKLKETKESNVSKDPKIGSKSKESAKSKREDESINKSKKKNQIQKQSQPSPKVCDTDKSTADKSSKKRRNSCSSTSSSLTASSFGGSTESKLHKEEPPKNGSVKEKDNKKENKKQKVSSKDMNTASGVKKQSSTSTKISFSDNNSSTTIEIKSVKKEKTWDNEVKKSRSKEFKSSEFKAAKDKSNSNTSSASVGSNKSKIKSETNCLKSSKVEANKHLKGSKEKFTSRPRKRSTSLSSESHLTPALSSPPSNSGPNISGNLDIESHESMSPLSSDNTSNSVQFRRIPNNNESNKPFISDDSESEASDEEFKPKNTKKKDFDSINKNKKQNSQTIKRKRDISKESNKKSEKSKSVGPLTPVPNFNDSLLSSDLIEMQKKLNESTNSDLLQTIVDIIEESGLFSLTKTTIDFDLMKLDDKTITKIKTHLY